MRKILNLKEKSMNLILRIMKNCQTIELQNILEKMSERPLIRADEKLRLSLAGAQEKLSLARINEKWYLPLNGSPSTHILKPARNGSLETLADNEYICMKIASGFGLEFLM